MLLDLLAHRRTNGLDDNWTMVLGLLTENLNSFHGRQTASIPAYNAVFRANYHVIMSCTVDEARNCNTIDKLQKVVMDDDGHINHFVQEHTDQKNDLHHPISDSYETDGLHYWEDNDDDNPDADDDDNNSQNYNDLFGDPTRNSLEMSPETPMKETSSGVVDEKPTLPMNESPSGVIHVTPTLPTKEFDVTPTLPMKIAHQQSSMKCLQYCVRSLMTTTVY